MKSEVDVGEEERERDAPLVVIYPQENHTHTTDGVSEGCPFISAVKFGNYLTTHQS